jgi:hypothetical protein
MTMWLDVSTEMPFSPVAMMLCASALSAATVSFYGVFDAWLTLQALDHNERWSGDGNAQLLARSGFRTAVLRLAQMLGLMYVGLVSATLRPRPVVAEHLEVFWMILSALCWISAIKEGLAMRDRRRIVIPPDER